MDNAASAAALFGDLLGPLDDEEVHIAHLDAERRVIAMARVQGERNVIDLPLADIIRDACAWGTRALILAHNHPSGDPMPSDADKSATRRLAELARLLDIHILDHLIFASGECVSLRGLGLI